MERTPGFVSLLNIQCSGDVESSEAHWFSSQCSEDLTVKERRKWSLKEGLILIGAWLNTRKYPIVSNEQRAGAFWKRIVEYYNSSPLLLGTTPRELGQCKQRWARINDQVIKFAGCYEAELREQRSGKNEDDVMKAALEIFHNDQKINFSFEHCWRELRHDMKWSFTYMSKENGKDKRKQVLDVSGEEVVAETDSRPIGVKAAKAAKRKKKSPKEVDLSHLQEMLKVKQEISRQQVLERLLAKPEPLSEMETSLKLKLMSEMLLDV